MDNSNGNGNGNGDGKPKLFHPQDLSSVYGRERRRALRDLEEALSQEEMVDREPPQVMEEYHIDCQGRKRLFRLSRFSCHTNEILQADEIRNGQPTGWHFNYVYDPETESPPYGEIRTKISERLATRDLARDPDTGDLHILNWMIRAQVSYKKDDREGGPDILVDGDLYTWSEIGRLLEPYEGWGLRIEIKETGEE